MIESLLISLANPARAKLLLDIYAEKQLTAKQLAEKYPDIPQATLYRHLKAMLTDGILKVAEERPIRGTVEKVYAPDMDLAADVTKMLDSNDGEMYFQLLTYYTMGIMQEFKEYAKRKNIDIKKDGSGFTVAPIYATTEEIEAALVKIGEILIPLYHNKSGEGRKLHNLCIITTPPKE
ncbi:MAG: helix-turn-helix domain-containing protein [Oscillospiraceae bacterium]|jgi:DNA-binding transcriptional ArsR family regulator|nr:helix-turn-helix domain-containing protein [Oscillospiraceae bacterium]